MENRDKTPVGEISPKPYFWGPFDEFQTIAQGGFASDDWLRHCKTYYARWDARCWTSKIEKIVKRMIGWISKTIVPRYRKEICERARDRPVGRGGGCSVDAFIRIV